MKAVVLAGGLRSGSEIPGSGLPRALWPFPHLPLITHVLDFLSRAGVGEIAICANGKTRLIASELAALNPPYLNLHYSEDPLPRGPAGCLRDLAEWLGDETFIAIQGTAFYDFDLAAMLHDHGSHGTAVTVGARRCPDDPALLEPAGVYLLEPSTLSLINAKGFQDVKEQFLPKVIASGQLVRSHALLGTATLIHSPGHYLSALREAIERAAAEIPDNQPSPRGFRTLSAASAIVAHESAVIHPAARLTGPLWIDAGAVIEEGAVLAGPVVLGPHTQVKAGALMHRTVTLSAAGKPTIIERGAEVFSAILPPGTRRPAPARVMPRHPKDAARDPSEVRPSPRRRSLASLWGLFEARR